MRTKPWFVYMVKCDDSSYYFGVTTDVKRRVHEHNTTKRGAKYTKSRRPVHLVWSWEFPNRTTAQRFEYRMKKKPRSEKDVIYQDPENWTP